MEKIAISFALGAALAGTFDTTINLAQRKLHRLGSTVKAFDAQKVSGEKLEKSAGALGMSRDKLSLVNAELLKLKLLMRGTQGAELVTMTTRAKGLEAQQLSLTRAIEKERGQVRLAQAAHERVSAIYTQESGRLGKLGKSIDAVRAQYAKMSAQENAHRAAKSRLSESRGALLGIAGTSIGLLAALKPAIAFETAMLGVTKQVAGVRDASGKLTGRYEEMGSAIQELGHRIPMTTNELAKLVEQGARQGVQEDEGLKTDAERWASRKKNLLSFAQVTSTMGTAFEMPVEQVGESVGKIANIFALPVKGFESLGDTINYLDDQTVAKGADIIDVMQRMGGTAKMLGLSAAQAAALGTTFLELGESAERAGTAGEGMLRQLQIAKMNPKRFQVGLSMIGMDAGVVSKGMVKDAQGMMIKVLEKIGTLPEERRMEAVTRLFGKDWGGAVAKVAGNIDKYKANIERATGASKDGSMGREAKAKAESTEGRITIFKNGVVELATSLGATLLPAVGDVLGAFNQVLVPLNAWIKDNKEVVRNIGLIAAGFATAMTAISAVKLGLIALRVAGLSFCATPIGLALSLLATAGMLLYENLDGIRGGLECVWEDLSHGATRASNGIGQAFSNAAAFLSGVLGGIGGAFLSMGQSIAAGANSTKDWVIARWEELMAFFNALPGRMLGLGADIVNGLGTGISNAWGELKNTVGGVADGIVSQAKDTLGIRSPSRVMMQVGAFVSEGLALGIGQGASRPLDAMGRLSQQLAAPLAAGALAFSLPSVAAQPDGMRAGAGGAASVSVQVTVYGDVNKESIERAVNEGVSRALAQNAQSQRLSSNARTFD